MKWWRVITALLIGGFVAYYLVTGLGMREIPFPVEVWIVVLLYTMVLASFWPSLRGHRF